MNSYDQMLVSTQGLQDRLHDPRLRIFDATTYVDRTPSGLKARSGRSDYEAAVADRADFSAVLQKAERRHDEARAQFIRAGGEALLGPLASAGH